MCSPKLHRIFGGPKGPPKYLCGLKAIHALLIMIQILKIQQVSTKLSSVGGVRDYHLKVNMFCQRLERFFDSPNWSLVHLWGLQDVHHHFIMIKAPIIESVSLNNKTSFSQCWAKMINLGGNPQDFEYGRLSYFLSFLDA